jgi:hypothetical protein
MTDETIDLNFIARRLDRLIDDASRQRDDMAVFSAMVMRIDGTMGALLTEIRATHVQIARIATHFDKLSDRVSKLEDV